MSKYREIPKDLLSVKTKLAFGLTKRQLICFGVAAALGLPAFFILRPYVSNTASMLVMMLIMMPGFALGLYEKNGLPLESHIKNFFETRYRRPSKRLKATPKQPGELPTNDSTLPKPTTTNQAQHSTDFSKEESSCN
jgi:hypothetical protein